MIKKIILFLILIADYFHKKKIINFLHTKGIRFFNCLFDIGAHKGESIQIFLKNFNVNEIYSFEPIPETFEILRTNIKKLKNKKIGCKIELENLAAGLDEQKIFIKKMVESSSSTIKEINVNSNYFNKKKKITLFIKN